MCLSSLIELKPSKTLYTLDLSWPLPLKRSRPGSSHFLKYQPHYGVLFPSLKADFKLPPFDLLAQIFPPVSPPTPPFQRTPDSKCRKAVEGALYSPPLPNLKTATRQSSRGVPLRYCSFLRSVWIPLQSQESCPGFSG